MNLEELRDVRRRERRQDSLQSLRESFYRDVADYVAELKAERERAADRADDPFSDPEVRRITDEIETAEEVVESIYERRVGKVVKHASFAAADMSHDDEGLTEEERDLFDDLVARVRENRTRVLDTLAAGENDDGGVDRETETGPDAASGEAASSAEPPGADAAPSTDGSPAEGETPPDPNDLLAAAMGGDDEASDGATDPAGATADERATGGSRSADEADPEPVESDAADAAGTAEASADRATVRITEDVGEIYGVDDRSYDLASEDVVQLPADNARPLVEKDAAERI